MSSDELAQLRARLLADYPGLSVLDRRALDSLSVSSDVGCRKPKVSLNPLVTSTRRAPTQKAEDARQSP